MNTKHIKSLILPYIQNPVNSYVILPYSDDTFDKRVIN